MSEPLDIDKIEEELKLISIWPWEAETEPHMKNCYIIDKNKNDVISEGAVGFLFENENDRIFISKAPERIAALIDRVRELELRNRSLERSLQHKTYEQIVKLGRGSDEV